MSLRTKGHHALAAAWRSYENARYNRRARAPRRTMRTIDGITVIFVRDGTSHVRGRAHHVSVLAGGTVIDEIDSSELRIERAAELWIRDGGREKVLARIPFVARDGAR